MKCSLSFFAAVALGLAAAAQSKADTTPSYIGITWSIPGGSQTLLGTNHGEATVLATGTEYYLVNTASDTVAATLTSVASFGASAITAASGSTPYPGTNLQETATVTDYNSSGTALHSANITFYSLLTGTIQSASIAGHNVSSALLTDTVVAYSTDGGSITKSYPLAGVTVNLSGVSPTLAFKTYTDASPADAKPATVGYELTPGVTTQGGSTPEPSGIVLGCMGLSCIGGVFWRSRRRKAVAALKAAV